MGTAAYLMLGLIFYMLYAMCIVMCIGASMANADGGVDDDEMLRTIAGEVWPVLLYLFAAVVYAVTAFSKHRSRVELAIEKMTLVHCAWIPLSCGYMLIASFAPPLLSYHSSPGAQAFRFVASAWPFVMLSVLVFFMLVGDAKEESK